MMVQTDDDDGDADNDDDTDDDGWQNIYIRTYIIYAYTV
jgi:hypothetical protein